MAFQLRPEEEEAAVRRTMQASCVRRKRPALCKRITQGKGPERRVAGRGEQLGSNSWGGKGGLEENQRQQGQRQKSRSWGVLYVCKSWAFFMSWKDPFGHSEVNGLRRAREVRGRKCGRLSWWYRKEKVTLGLWSELLEN